MRPKSAKFVTSAAKKGQYPKPNLPEVAIAGRSNVGKSSLINALVARSGLAKTSNTPGRTRLLNWFHVVPARGGELNLVDLPGYGYAKVSRSLRESWRPMIEDYLVGRDVLCGVVLLIDIRRPAQEEERGLVEWLVAENVPVVVVLTKADKLAKAKRKPMALKVKRELGLKKTPILSSAAEGLGLSELWGSVSALVRG